MASLSFVSTRTILEQTQTRGGEMSESAVLLPSRGVGDGVRGSFFGLASVSLRTLSSFPNRAAISFSCRETLLRPYSWRASPCTTRTGRGAGGFLSSRVLTLLQREDIKLRFFSALQVHFFSAEGCTCAVRKGALVQCKKDALAQCVDFEWLTLQNFSLGVSLIRIPSSAVSRMPV